MFVRRPDNINTDGGKAQTSVGGKPATARPIASVREPGGVADMERDRLGQWTYYDKGSVSNNLIRGLDHMRDPRLNKVSFSKVNDLQTADQLFDCIDRQ